MNENEAFRVLVEEPDANPEADSLKNKNLKLKVQVIKAMVHDYVGKF